jgi:hypothetical protein
MQNPTQSAKLITVESLIRCSQGESVKCAGILETDGISAKVIGLSGHKQEINLSDCLVSVKSGIPYFIIGEVQDGKIKVRICKELILKKYSLDYYLKTLPGYLYPD